MAAAACWEESDPSIPADILSLLNASNDPALSELELLAAIPEWKVDIPGGDTASQTDILAIVRNSRGLVILGVEAKVDEPFGPTLGEKRKSGSAGQKQRITFLEKELLCTRPLDDSIRYQLLHRTVSAILTARLFHAEAAVMMVQSFSKSSRWREDFDEFSRELGCKRICDGLLIAEKFTRPKLYLGWCNGDPRFAEIEVPSNL
jgi:hypothetical protein